MRFGRRSNFLYPLLTRGTIVIVAIHMNHNFTQIATMLALLLFNVTIIGACSKDGHIFIKLSDKHLKDTPAGFWLATFDIDYSPGAERIKKQVMVKLQSEGILVDENIGKDGVNAVKTRLWKFRGQKIREQYYKGGIWEGPKIIPFQEYYNGGWNAWITVEFDEPIPYSKLLPDDHAKINPKRKYEHTATIESSLDQGRRLFLFGYGSTCKRISLF